MNKGDILLVYKDKNQQECMPFLIYDRYMAIGANLLGLFLVPIKTLTQNKHCMLLTLAIDVSWQKKKKFNDFVSLLATKTYTLTFKERLNFMSYIVWLYKTFFNINLIEYPLPIKPQTLIESKYLEIIELDGGIDEEKDNNTKNNV